MDRKPPMMSTPKKGRYSSLFKELARLPSILFGHYSRDTCDLLRLDTPNKSFQPTLDSSPCRHSPRLLSNGYYMFEDDTYNTDEEGNLSFSPTKCTISYKENTVRVFRRRRRLHAQRALDLSNHGNQEGWRPPYEEELADCEPLDFIQTYSNCTERIAAHTSESIIGPRAATSIPQMLQSEQSDFKAKEYSISEQSQDTGSLSLIPNSENRSLLPVLSSPCPAEVEEISERSFVYGSIAGNSCINKGDTMADDTKNLIPLQPKTISLSRIGSIEEISKEELGKPRQDINICTALLYISIIFLICLCARFWTSAIFPSLLMLSLAYILFPVSRRRGGINRIKEDT
ncbi:transmembrane protein 71 [Pyxicephalus adspersus]|uniref:transmembrane protein 71 n=1 Tax=Pyxicephalus adspersus TaxID=30357 RepID=UPI003B5CC032